MKKVAMVFMSLVLIAMLGFSAFATDFVGSIESKPPVEVDPSNIRILDKDTQEFLENFQPVIGTRGLDADAPSDAEKDSPADKALREVAREFSRVANVGELNKEIEEALNEKGIKPEDSVVSDIIYISLNQEESDEEIVNDRLISFRLKQLFSEGQDFILIQKDNKGKWGVVENIELEEDGYMRITTGSLGIFATVVERTPDMPINPDGPYSPKTDIGTGYKFAYAGVAVLFVAAAVFFFVKSKKRRGA